MNARVKTPELFALAALIAAAVLSTPLRAQAEGELDPGFGNGGVRRIDLRVAQAARSNVATDVALDAEGRILLAGTARRLPSASGEERLAVARLDPAGELDPLFAAGGRATIQPFPDDPEQYRYSGGRIAIGGDGSLYVLADASSLPTGWVLVRLDDGGALDPSFGSGGVVSRIDVAIDGADLGLTPDGRILVLEDFVDEGADPINVEMAVWCFHADGSLDATWGDGGLAVVGFNLGGSWDDEAGALLVQPDGRVLIAGSAAVGPAEGGDVDFAIARLEPDGDLDPTFSGNGLAVIEFDFGGVTEDFAQALALDPQGRLLVAGTSADEAAVARLRADGSVDPAFGINGRMTFHFGGASPSLVDAGFGIAVQDDGRVLIVGRGAPAGGGGMRFAVARLTAAGALDPSFGGDGTRLFDFATDGGQLSVARAVGLLPDGRLLAAGGAERSPGDFDFVVARFHLALVFADGFETGDTSRW